MGTYMPFFIKAASLALHKTPILNSHLSPTAEELTYKADHNISIAVNSAKGLVVPNIKAVQSQSVFEIAGELERLMGLAQEGTLPADDLADGTFALSNIGAIGGTYATPVVMTPQVAIGALGRLQTLPRYDDEMNVVPARLISASWYAATPLGMCTCVCKHRTKEFADRWVFWFSGRRTIGLSTARRWRSSRSIG